MFQNLIIVGNLGNDPMPAFTPNGTATCKFSLAVRNGEDAIWFRVVTFGKTAENVGQYLAKGKRIMVDGRLQGDNDGNPKIWFDKNGNARASFEVVGDRIVYLSPKAESENEEVPF